MIKKILFLVGSISTKPKTLYLKTLNKIVSQKDAVKIKIEEYCKLDRQTKIEIDKTFKKVFNRTLAEHEKDWAIPQWVAIGLVKNKIVSLRYFLKTTVLFDGEEITIGGTGGLLTLPAYRGLGIAPKIIDYVNDFIFTELHLDCILFICGESMVQYFTNIGWYPANCQLYFRQNGARDSLKGMRVMLKSQDKKYNPSVIEVDGKLW